MALIPIGTNYHVDIKGAAYKHVLCEKCQTEYYYRMERDALAVATSWLFLGNQSAQSAARKRAERKLETQLSKESDPVPCPNCGWFQEHMIKYARRQYLPWMRGLGRLLILIAVPFLYFALAKMETLEIIGFSILGVGLGLILLRILLSWRQDPNLFDEQKRINYGKRKSVTTEQFQKIFAEPQTEA